MEKVLILTYRFPPCRETGANRPLAWAKYLHKSNYKPIIVSREWQHSQVAGSEYIFKISTITEPIHEVHDTHEVYYLPYTGNFRTRYFMKNGVNTIYKFLSFLDKVLIPLGLIQFSEYLSFYQFAKDYLSRNPEVKKVIITGGPFEMFRFGQLLTKSHGIKWIADYRDPWTTDEISMRGKSLLHDFIYRLEQRAEKQWCTTASYITCVSEHLTKRIEEFLGVPGEVIYNGFFDLIKEEPVAQNPLHFNILFNGTLYPFHKIEVFLDGFKMAVDKYKGRANLVFQAIGIRYSEASANRVENYMRGYESNIELTHRIAPAEYLKIQQKAHVLAIFGSGVAGITSSKIFDYIRTPKPVIHAPNDRDVVEKILTETGQGVFADTAEEILAQLSVLIDLFLAAKDINVAYNVDAALVYSREYQTKKIAKILDKI